MARCVSSKIYSLASDQHIQHKATVKAETQKNREEMQKTLYELERSRGRQPHFLLQSILNNASGYNSSFTDFQSRIIHILLYETSSHSLLQLSQNTKASSRESNTISFPVRICRSQLTHYTNLNYLASSSMTDLRDKTSPENRRHSVSDVGSVLVLSVIPTLNFLMQGFLRRALERAKASLDACVNYNHFHPVLTFFRQTKAPQTFPT